MLEIIPILVGRAVDVPIDTFTWGRDSGSLVESPHVIWAIRSDGGVVVVDTGSPSADWSTITIVPSIEHPTRIPPRR